MLLSSIPSTFKARRDALIKKNPGAVFILPAGDEVLRNPDVHYPFRQESNFYYLTGFDEPESFVVLSPAKGAGTHRMSLFVRKRDPEREMWEGERYGTEGATEIFGADEAYPIEEFDRRLPELLQGSDKVFYRVGLNEHVDRRVLGALEVHRRSLGRSGKSLPPLTDPNETIGEMRLFKSPEEAEMMRKACSITAQGHKYVMKELKPGMNESEIEAMIDYSFRRGGCQRLGYGSIVAGGVNAACLHYRSNNEALKDGDLILIDAGGEYGYYTSDITRTFPVGREYTKAQARAYDLVLESQKAAVDMAKPGATLPGIHRRVLDILVEGFLSMGLLDKSAGNVDAIIKAGGHRRFYPHNTSHWLGMDVHDLGLYTQSGEPRKLEAGMCLTIEPGFYVQPGDKEAPSEYHRIGIRIEDDILITASGNENLTREAPKERAEIEALRQQA